MDEREREIRDHRHMNPLRPGDTPASCKTCDALSLLDRERRLNQKLTNDWTKAWQQERKRNAELLKWAWRVASWLEAFPPIDVKRKPTGGA